MSKRGNRQGYAVARVNANVEERSIIEDAMALSAESEVYPSNSLDTCVNFNGTCCTCCGCSCPPSASFAVEFNARRGKATIRRVK